LRGAPGAARTDQEDEYQKANCLSLKHGEIIKGGDKFC